MESRPNEASPLGALPPLAIAEKANFASLRLGRATALRHQHTQAYVTSLVLDSESGVAVKGFE